MAMDLGMKCPNDATLLALVGGELDAEALSSADEHLDRCTECRAVVLALARSQENAEPRLSPELAAVGQRIGRYLVLGHAGSGAMGDVYAAWDGDLGRRIALKILRPAPGALDPSERHARTLREAQAMARLSHPHAIGVYEVGAHGDSVYLAMEWVSGQTLREWSRARPRSWREVRDAFIAAGAALAAAHRAGLVHRDFKPDNVLVAGEAGVKVGDFGLASLGDAPPTPVPATTPHGVLTQTGAIVGTPAYMAPEQLDARGADARSDQFAFCVSFWEVLFGTRPFEGRNVAELRERYAAGPIAPPKRRVPAWLMAALRRGLSLEPSKRFDSMDALGKALVRDRALRGRRLLFTSLAVIVAVGAGAYLAGRPSASDPCAGGRSSFASVWNADRRRTIEAAFAKSGVSSAPALARAVDRFQGEWLQGHRAACEARMRREQSDEIVDARMHCLARRAGELDALLGTFEHAQRATALGALDAVSALPDVADCEAVTALSAMEPRPRDPAIAAAIAAVERDLDGVRARGASGGWSEARTAASAIVARAEAVGWRPLTAEARLFIAQQERRTGAFDAAERSAYAALWAAEAARDDLGAARAWLELGALAGERGRIDEAELLANHAHAAIARAGRPLRLEAALQHARGQLAFERGRLDEAQRDLDAALAARRRLFGEDHPEVTRTMTALGNLARARSDLSRALAWHERALAIDARVLGADHPALARHHHNLAGVLRLQGKLVPAMEHYRRAAELERSGHGDAHPSVGLTENSMGLVELDRGNSAAAAAHFRRALAVLEAAAHPDRAAVLHNLGLAEARAGRHRAALRRFEQALPLYEQQLGARHERVARLRLAAGRSRAALGERRKASVDFAAARSIAAVLGLKALAREAKSAARELAAKKKPPAPAKPSPPRNRGTYLPAKSWDAE
jgi:tetratricopeptide (TPR) repeat protein